VIRSAPVRQLYEVLLSRAQRVPNAIALGAQDGLTWKTLTSRELLDLTDRLAVELQNLGVQAGDRVVTWVPSHWRTPVYLFALWKLGAIVVPFDRETNPEAGARIVESVEPRLVLVGFGEQPTWAHSTKLTEWWTPGTRVDRAPAQSWEPPDTDLAAIFFTSGTTGNPKGCMISHSNLLSQIEAASERIPLGSSARLASILPLSHLFELTCGLLYPMYAGAAVHYIPSRRGPDIVRVLAEQRITHMMAVPQLLSLMGQALEDQLRKMLPPPVYAAVHALAERVPLSMRRRLFFPVHRRLGGHFRLMAAGGAALAPETQQRWELLGVRVVQGYGTSECSPIIACGAPDGSTPMGSVGKPVRDVEVRLNEAGELLVRGPNVMRGYWKDPERTAEVLQDGWYATGDLARIDADGNIWLAGRAKDLIVLPSGMNVWPTDVEDVLRANPFVADAAVTSVARPGGGASLHAYLLPASASAAAEDPGSIVEAANARLARHQRLASASWWAEPDFPRTSTLKVRRHMLPPPDAAAVRIDTLKASDDPVAQAVAGAAHVPGVLGHQSLGDLGLDSLGLVEVALAIEEKTGRVIQEADLRMDMTVDQLRQVVANAPSSEDGAVDGRDRGGRPGLAPPMWPYTWGRGLRWISFPLDLLYRYGVTQTRVLGAEHLANLPRRVVLAGTHHGFTDVPLVREGLKQTPARRLADRLVVAAGAGGVGWRSAWGMYGMLAYGLYPLVTQGERDASLRSLVKLAERGNAVLIFPQGAHVTPEEERSDAPRTRFKTGVAHIAGALQAAVVPFGVAGTERLIPPDAERFKGPQIAGVPVSITRGPLVVAFGPVMTLAPGEEPEAFAARLQKESFALTRQAEKALD
jgi:long-chain acyl-CoA synthetase